MRGPSRSTMPGRSLSARAPMDPVHAVPPQGAIGHLIAIVAGCVLAPKDVNVEYGEIDQVEAHRPSAAARAPIEVGSSPIEHRHEIVANGRKPACRQILETPFPGRYMRAHLFAAGLDRLGDGEAFDNFPFEPAGPRLLLAPGNFFLGPHAPGRDMVERRNDGLCSRLQRIWNAYPVNRTEPPPCLEHQGSSAV